MDEFVFGAREAAWPLIRADLDLSYTQIGWLLALPHILGNLIEPVLGILSDTWRRRVLILGGGVVLACSMLLIALSRSFVLLMFAFIVAYPASGAFVSLSQAALMDGDPDRREPNMARWTFAGSVGVVAGPLALSAALVVGLGWRELFLLFAVLLAGMLIPVRRLPFKKNGPERDDPGGKLAFKEGLIGAARALRRRDVVRWAVLLQFADLMLDVLLGFLALYLVDVAGVPEKQAGVGVAVWTGVGLLGDLLLIPLVERVRGLVVLRFSALCTLVLFPAFLLAPPLGIKLILLGGLGLMNSGWYAILQAQLYASLPGKSGTALAVNNVGSLAGGLIPLLLGLIAQYAGLGVAMWLLLAGPAALLIGIPRRRSSPSGEEE